MIMSDMITQAYNLSPLKDEPGRSEYNLKAAL